MHLDDCFPVVGVQHPEDHIMGGNAEAIPSGERLKGESQPRVLSGSLRDLFLG